MHKNAWQLKKAALFINRTVMNKKCCYLSALDSHCNGSSSPNGKDSDLKFRHGIHIDSHHINKLPTKIRLFVVSFHCIQERNMMLSDTEQTKSKSLVSKCAKDQNQNSKPVVYLLLKSHLILHFPND